LDLLNNFADLLHEVGDVCEFGCDENDIESVKEMILNINSIKGIRVVKSWSIWSLDVSDKDKAALQAMGFQPKIIFSTNIIFDLHSPYAVGTGVRSTLLVNFYKNCIFETKNTFYILAGTGTTKRVDPKLAFAVFF